MHKHFKLLNGPKVAHEKRVGHFWPTNYLNIDYDYLSSLFLKNGKRTDRRKASIGLVEQVLQRLINLKATLEFQSLIFLSLN